MKKQRKSPRNKKQQRRSVERIALPSTNNTQKVLLHSDYSISFRESQERIFIMENVITKTSQQFGTIRTIEGKPQLWCGSDVAKALGYAKPRNAISAHCKGALKRGVPSNGGVQQMLFIPEADVYRLICHSKLPKAQEFEKWVFEDVVPEAVHNCKQPICDSYEYFDKTYNGQPVLTTTDVAKLTGTYKSSIEWYLRTDRLLHGTDYYRLEGRTLMQFKEQNPKYPKNVPCVNIITKSGFEKLVKLSGAKVGTPKLFIEGVSIQPPIPVEPQYTPTDSMVDLLSCIDREMILIAEYRRRLLNPCSLKEAETYKIELAKALRDLRWFHFDTEDIKIH